VWSSAWFQTSAVKWTTTAFFWGIMHWVVVMAQKNSSQYMGLFMNAPPPLTSAKHSVELCMWQLNFVLMNIKYKSRYEHHNISQCIGKSWHTLV
jgi:hypothetical protein